jgi:predicted DsbA family dithiol-disulfide isomerase
MRALGADVGIAFRFAGTVSNTLHAHRVLHYFQDGKGLETATRIIEGLYRRYFEEERDPASRETLVEACIEAGIAEWEARAVVEDERVGLLEVKRLIRQQELNGIDAIPHVVIEGRRRDVTVVGARGVDEYVRILRTVIKESE